MEEGLRSMGLPRLVLYKKRFFLSCENKYLGKNMDFSENMVFGENIVFGENMIFW